MKKILSVFLAMIIFVLSLSITIISYSDTKPFAEDVLVEVQKKTGFIPNRTAKITGNCYGFISAVCENLHGIKYDGEGLYGNYKASHSAGNYYTVATYETAKTTPTQALNKEIKEFFINNAQPGDVVHYGAYTTGTSNYSTHTIMIQHIDREKMLIFHSNYETRTLSRESCHIDTIVWDSFVNDSTKAIYNDDGSLYSHNNLFYNKMKQTGLGITINRLTNYDEKYTLVDNSDALEELEDATPVVIPEKVKDLEITEIKPTKIGIRWQKVDNADKYYISVSNDTKGTNFSKTVTDEETTLNNLTENNTYTIKVRAVNKAGNGKYSSSVTVKAESQTDMVEDFAVKKATTSTISYTWKKVKNATKYYMEIENKTKGGSYTKTVTTNSATIQGLTAGNVYSVRVRAYTKKGGWGSYTDNLITASKPAKVKNLTVTSPKTKKVSAEWKKGSSNKSGYQVYISTDKNFKKNVVKKTINDKTKTKYSNSKLKKNKRYFVKVRSYVTVNGKKIYSSWSDIVSVKCK